MSATDPATIAAPGSTLAGTIVKGRERITSRAAMAALGCEMKQTGTIMRSLGWQGPFKARVTDETGKSVVVQCYDRIPPLVPSMPLDVALSVADELPAKLERVTIKGLHNLEEVLDQRFDLNNAGLMKAKVTAASVAIQAQLRADEQRLRTKTTGDVLAKLLKIIEKERELAQKPIESVRYHNPADQSAEHQQAEPFSIVVAETD